MGIDYDAIERAGGLGKGPTRFDRQHKKAVQEMKAWVNVCLKVNQRDQYSCRVCDVYTSPTAIGVLCRGHHHHIIYRSAGGPDETWNVILLCARCHNDEHQGQFELEGDADQRDPLTRKLNGVALKKPAEGGMEIVRWI